MVSLRPYHLISSEADWKECLSHLQSESRLAIDLEANSMHAYREQVCLIQISIPSKDFIIDPLIDTDWEQLGQLIEEPKVEKIFHAAEYDLILLKRQFGWQINNLFDTMWAARILGYERCGLANLLNQFYGVELDKRYQKSNWCRRPLSPEQLSYAQRDTHYLLDFRDRLVEELIKVGRKEEAFHIFQEQTYVTLPNIDFDTNGFWSITGVKDLSSRQQSILKALYIFRDKQARKRDQPHFKVFGERTLFEIADLDPDSINDMRYAHGMSGGQLRRYGHQLLSVVHQARKQSAPAPRKKKKRPSDEIVERYDKLHNWRKVTAQERGVESDVIISREALWSIAKEFPKTREALATIQFVGQWRVELYGNEMLSLINP